MFCIDERILSSSFILADWPLSRVFLKNEAQFPWFILVPRIENIQEIYQLNKDHRQLLMEEINQLSLIAHDYFNPDKLNIGALGNVVSQLHVHVVVRTETDNLWPQGIWQASFSSTPYERSKLDILLPDLHKLITAGTSCLSQLKPCSIA